MSIAVFSNFVNGLPTYVFDGKDVSMVLLVDPPVELPPFFLANKGVLDTTTKTIKVYDATGNTVAHDFDISGTDLTPINEAIGALQGDVSDLQTDVGNLQGDVSTNTTNIGTNTTNIGTLQGQVGDLESLTSKHTTDIKGVQDAIGATNGDVSALTLRVGKNETDIAAVLLTANAADKLSKENKGRLDNLPAPPNLDGYIKTGDDASLSSVSFGDNTKIDTQPDLGLVLQGDYIYGKAQSGLELFFVENGNFNVKSKKIQKVNDGQAEDDAANIRQLGAVETKADNAQGTADAADSLSKANQTAIGNLSTTVGENASGISTNAKDISDLSVKVNGVETTANAADTLSKTNASSLSNALLKDEYGWDVDNLNIYNVSRLSRTNNAVNSSGLSIGDADVNLHGDTVGITSGNSATTYAVFTSGGLNLNEYPLTRLGSGGDVDNNAANIGDVKRITTEGSGLKPTDESWDMFGYPVVNIGTSTIGTSAATVAQVNDVEAKIPNLDNYVQTGTTATLNAVMFGGDTKVDYQVDLGLVLQGDTIYGKSQAGYEHFFIEDGKFNVKSKVLQKLRDGVADDDAATMRQVNAVDAKADTNAGNLSNLSTTVGQHDTQIGTNTSNIATVTSTANAADALSKDNKTRLDNLPPSPDLSGYVKNGDDVNFGTAQIDVVKVSKGDDSSKFSDILIDGNTNTQMNFVGDTHFYIRSKTDNSKGLEAFQIDSSGRFVVKQKIKTPMITNPSTGTTNSTTDKASFIDLTEDNVNKIGAKSSVLFDVGGNLSAGVYADHVNFNTDYVTGVKVRDIGSRQPYDAINWETLQGFTPSLDGYAQLDTEVRFSKISIKNDFAGSTTDPYFWCDPANGNTVYAATGTLYFNRYDNEGTKSRWALVDTNNRLTLDNAAKVQRLMNKNTWSTDSSTDKAGFVRWDMDNRVIVGAKQDITFQINGKDVYKVKETGIDFTGLGGSAVIRHDHNIDVSVGDTKNVAFKSNGMKLLAAVDADSKDINHMGNLTFNGGKKLKGSDVGNLIIENLGGIHRNHTNDANSVTLGNGSNTYKSNGHLFHDNNGNEIFFVGTNVNVNSRKLQNVAKSETDADTTNLGHIKELIAAGGGSGGAEYENYITRSESGSTTFYETTNGQQNAWVVATNSTFQGAMTYTFDYSRQGQEVVVGVENRTKGSVIAKLYSRQSTVLTVEVPSYHVFTARYVPDIGKYVYNIGSWFPTTQRVITLEDINPTLSSDNKQMTKNIIAAMPNNTILIAYHNPQAGSPSKYNFITSGKNGGSKEVTKSVAIISKQGNGHATGISTTEGSAYTYSRVLDGTQGLWSTNSSSNSRMASSEIDLSGVPEDQLFFTSDLGLMETYIVSDETGEVALRQLEGYNIPKHDSDIAALEVQTEKNRSQTHYFINESDLSYDWPDSERRPLVEVQVLNSTQTINGSSVTVTDNDTHKYSGTYNTVGAIAVNAAGNWTVQYCYHNAYSHPTEPYYVAFNQANMTWQIIESENPHTSIGQKAASVTVQLGGASSLPESFGDYTIDPNFEDINSLEFLSCETGVSYDDVNSRVLISFGTAKPSGYVVLK